MAAPETPFAGDAGLGLARGPPGVGEYSSSSGHPTCMVRAARIQHLPKRKYVKTLIAAITMHPPSSACPSTAAQYLQQVPKNACRSYVCSSSWASHNEGRGSTVALRGEHNDVITALQGSKWMAGGVPVGRTHIWPHRACILCGEKL